MTLTLKMHHWHWSNKPSPTSILVLLTQIKSGKCDYGADFQEYWWKHISSTSIFVETCQFHKYLYIGGTMPVPQIPIEEKYAQR
jgi:hypothetical protein